MTLVEVILPLPFEGTFTYAVPEEKKNFIFPGFRVIVPFGKKKIYTGIVFSLHNEIPLDYQPKELLNVLDHKPIVNKNQLAFFQWMAKYYMCSMGEVVNAALPASLKLSSKSYVALNQGIDPDELDIDERKKTLLTILKSNDLPIKDVAKVLGLKQPQRILKELSDKGYINLFEKTKDKYRSKVVKKIKISSEWLEDQNLEILLNELEVQPKQQDVLLAYLKDVPVLENPENNVKGILKSKLLMHGISPSSLKTLIKKGVLEEWDEKMSRFECYNKGPSSETILSASQQSAKEAIKKIFNHHSTVLMHGVTGSGKTEIYIELIKEQVANGKEVLYLLPEIALTTQIIARLHKVFNGSFGIYHSRYSDNERAEVWQKVKDHEYQFVVGVRSAIFLPFSNLGMIIIDEEHETSYKQYEATPRYHARDAAIYLSTIHQSNVLMGTATPALETYKNTLDGKYGLINLTERYGNAPRPKLEFVNIQRERKRKKLKGNFSLQLVEAIEKSLAKKEQVIIFQNRRGYAAYIICDHCAIVPKCPNCTVSLTYHQYNNKLVCHYCGYNQSMYTECLHCGHQELRQVGYGTEELEEELKILFPQAIVQRMDLETTRGKYGYQRIIEKFEEGSIDILVGTQMISKGLYFHKVNLVGIFDTDRLIHFPDFRSHERAYHLITQISGRIGWKSKEGLVIIQTNDPDQSLLQHVRNYDYPSFFQSEVMERKHFHYPPYTRLINITFKHQNKTTSFQSANCFFHEIRKPLANQKIIGPAESLIAKIRNLYLHEITLKLDKKGINLHATKEYLKSTAQKIQKIPAFRRVKIVFDVDPV